MPTRLARILCLVVLASCNPLANRREKQVCAKLESTCGPVIGDDCVEGLVALEEPLGPSYDKALSCAAEADSCPEILGCLAGGFSNQLMHFGREFTSGMQRSMQ